MLLGLLVHGQSQKIFLGVRRCFIRKSFLDFRHLHGSGAFIFLCVFIVIVFACPGILMDHIFLCRVTYVTVRQPFKMA